MGNKNKEKLIVINLKLKNKKNKIPKTKKELNLFKIIIWTQVMPV